MKLIVGYFSVQFIRLLHVKCSLESKHNLSNVSGGFDTDGYPSGESPVRNYSALLFCKFVPFNNSIFVIAMRELIVVFFFPLNCIRESQSLRLDGLKVSMILPNFTMLLRVKRTMFRIVRASSGYAQRQIMRKTVVCKTLDINQAMREVDEITFSFLIMTECVYCLLSILLLKFNYRELLLFSRLLGSAWGSSNRSTALIYKLRL